MSVIEFPKRPFRQTVIKPAEMYAQPEPSDEMVWELCPYLRQRADESRCEACPREEIDPNYGPVTRGCYVMASEACRVLFAMQSREGLTKGAKVMANTNTVKANITNPGKVARTVKDANGATVSIAPGETKKGFTLDAEVARKMRAAATADDQELQIT